MPEAAKCYFGSREVKEYGNTDAGLTWIVFNDETREVVSTEEWDACKSEAPVEESFEFDKKRVLHIHKAILDILKAKNARLEDLSLIFRLTIDAIQLAANQAKEAAFGQPAERIRLDDVQKVLDETNTDGKVLKTQVVRRVQGDVITW